MDIVLLVTKSGLLELRDKLAQPYIDEIKKAESGEGPFVFYENGQPVYLAVEDGKDANSQDGDNQKISIKAMTFPQAKDYGTTSPSLYAMVVTYALTVARLLELSLKPKLSMMAQAKRIMTLAAPICVIGFLVFLMAVSLGG